MALPEDWITTIGMIGGTLGSGCAFAFSVKAICCGKGWEDGVSRACILVTMLLSAGVFSYRAATVHESWEPLQSHVDGLSLLGALLAMVVAYFQWTKRLPGVGLFVTPVLTLLLLWGVCSSWWTWRGPFSAEGTWDGVHVLSVYGGLLAVVGSAASGAMWLYVDRQLRRKDHQAMRFRVLRRFSDLESIERMLTWTATLGFVLITVAGVTGVVTATGSEETALGAGWYYSPKVVLAVLSWLAFALVMHVRLVPVFRGRRAAILAIVGFLLLVAVFGIVAAMGGSGGDEEGASEHFRIETEVVQDNGGVM